MRSQNSTGTGLIAEVRNAGANWPFGMIVKVQMKESRPFLHGMHIQAEVCAASPLISYWTPKPNNLDFPAIVGVGMKVRCSQGDFHAVARRHAAWLYGSQ